MKKSDFFKRNEEVLEPLQENKLTFDSFEKREEETNRVYKKKTGIIDRNIIQYVIDNFPSMSVNIRDALTNLVDTLEGTIDFIEDKSSNAIKAERDFELAEAYRSKSKAIYDVVQNIDEYIDWMRTEYDKAMDDNSGDNSGNAGEKSDSDDAQLLKSDIQDDSNAIQKADEINEATKEKLNTLLADAEEIEIYKDFSAKEPKAFQLDENIVEVENWDDLLVKVAEVLTKKYKNNKYSDIIVNDDIKIIGKRSMQNTWRDSVIDMLKEYKINLGDFKVIAGIR